MSLAGLSWVSLIASSKGLGKWSRYWAQGALNYWGSTGEVGMQSGAVPWAWATPKRPLRSGHAMKSPTSSYP